MIGALIRSSSSKQLGVAAVSAAFAGAVFLLVGGALAAPPPPPPPPPKETPGKYMGTSQCKNCHERGLSGRDPKKWPRLKEVATWSKDDQHAFAYKRLEDEDPPRGKKKWRSRISSEDIFDALGAEEDSASESLKCTSCHGVVVHPFGKPKWLPDGAERAVYANEDLQMGYDAAEGVSCDGCHGPASGWIQSHEKEHWTTKQWLKLGGASDPAKASKTLWEQKGLYYSKDLVLWAQQCVRCHLQIETDLLDAQHPDLEAFELWDQTKRVPPHWRDYSKEADKPEYPGAGPMHIARMWMVGQAVALQASLEQIVVRTSAPKKPTTVAKRNGKKNGKKNGAKNGKTNGKTNGTRTTNGGGKGTGTSGNTKPVDRSNQKRTRSGEWRCYQCWKCKKCGPSAGDDDDGDDSRDKHLKKATERAGSHYTVLRHALAQFPACAAKAKALATAMKSAGSGRAATAKKGAQAALKALDGLAYTLARAKVTKGKVAAIIKAIEGDPDTKRAGQWREIRKLSLTALKKVK